MPLNVGEVATILVLGIDHVMKFPGVIVVVNLRDSGVSEALDGVVLSP